MALKEKKSSVKANVVYQMVYEILALLLPLITSPYIARVLGAEKIGIYSYTYSIVYYFGIASQLGVKNYGNREIAKNRGSRESVSKTFWSIYSLQLILSVVLFAAYIFYAFNFNDEYRMYSLIQIIFLFSYFLDINWFYFGMEQFKLTVTRNFIVKLLMFFSVFIFVRTADDLWKYFVIMSASSLLSQIIVWMFLPRYVDFKLPKIKDVFVHLKPMLVLFIPIIAVSLYNIMDKIMVGAISTKTQLGFYENSEKIITCVKSVIVAFGTVMMPRMSKLAAEGNRRESKRYMQLSIEIVMFIAFALSFGIAAVANIFAPIFWGDEFAPCGSLLIGLCVSIPFYSFANVIRTQYLIPNNMDREYIISVIAGAIINLIANSLLISRYDAMGAVVGTIFAEMSVCIIQCFFVRHKVDMKLYLQKSVFFLFVGFIMYVLITFINRGRGNSIALLLIDIVIGGVFYLLVSFIYFYRTKNELLINLMSKFVKKK